MPNLKDLSENDIEITPPAEQIVFEYRINSRVGKLFVLPVGKSIKRKISFNLYSKLVDDILIK